MFAISSQTYQALAENVLHDFRHRLLLALKHVFGDRIERLPDDQLIELANHAIDRAEDYGMDSEYGVWSLYAAMFVFGRNFNKNEQHQWAREILSDESYTEEAIVGLLGLRIYMETGKTI